jgi:hypothetical protein
MGDYGSFNGDGSKSKKKKKRPMVDRLGIFKRLPIDPVEFMHYTPEMQEQLVKRYIQAGVFPDNIDKIMRKANKVYAKMINTENDADYLKNPNENYSYPGAPTADRSRAKTKLPFIKIEKLIEKKIDEEDEESGSDLEMKLSKKYDKHTMAMKTVSDPK